MPERNGRGQFVKGHSNFNPEGTGNFQKGFHSKTEFKKGNTINKRGYKCASWKGEIAGYGAKHKWIRDNYGNPPYCEDCGKLGKVSKGHWNIDWSNCDHKYRRVRKDYNGRCKKCHIKYDKLVNNNVKRNTIFRSIQ